MQWSHLILKQKQRPYCCWADSFRLDYPLCCPLNNRLQIVVSCYWNLWKLPVPYLIWRWESAVLGGSRTPRGAGSPLGSVKLPQGHTGCAVGHGPPSSLNWVTFLSLGKHMEQESLRKAMAVFLHFLRLLEVRMPPRGKKKKQNPGWVIPRVRAGSREGKGVLVHPGGVS